MFLSPTTRLEPFTSRWMRLCCCPGTPLYAAERFRNLESCCGVLLLSTSATRLAFAAAHCRTAGVSGWGFRISISTTSLPMLAPTKLNGDIDLLPALMLPIQLRQKAPKK